MCGMFEHPARGCTSTPKVEIVRLFECPPNPNPNPRAMVFECGSSSSSLVPPNPFYGHPNATVLNLPSKVVMNLAAKFGHASNDPMALPFGSMA